MPKDCTAEAARMTATDVLDSLELAYTGRRPGRFVLFREFPLEAETRGRSSYRIDGLLIELSHRRRVNRTAIEVKVDRRDFQRELLDIEKRRRAMRIADCFYFAVPFGLIQPSEVPVDCGLLWIRPGCAPGHMRGPKIAPAPAPDWPLVWDMLRRAFAAGQEDAAKRTPLTGWAEVDWLAEIVADPFAEDSEREEALNHFKKELLRHGRKEEAEHIRVLKNELRQVLGKLEALEPATA